MSDSIHVLLTNKKRGWNGEALMIAETARGMAERGYRVTLATNPDAHIVTRLAGSDVEILPLTLLKDRPQVAWTLLKDIKALAKYIRSEDVKLVHCNSSFDTWTAALTLRKNRLKPPLIRTKHNLKLIRKNHLNRWLYSSAVNHFIVASRAVESDILSSEMVPRENLHLIPYGIVIDEEELKTHNKKEARKLLEIPQDAEIVAYISRLTRRKDPATLIGAVNLLTENHPRLRTLIVGRGTDEEQAELRELAEDNRAVEFWGHRDDVPRILAASDAFVLPSLTEAFGLAPLEAMLQGVPTIVSDAEGFRDFVTNDANGLVFPRGNVDSLAAAIQRILTDEALRDKLSTDAQRTVRQRFSVDRMIDDIESLYHQALKS